jgi:D-alanyl-lipoteichoic acid acyltransferase DltB (MBOAT superfamily)
VLFFDAAAFFANLLVLAVIVAPLYRYTSSIALRQVLMTATGIVLLYHVAPRLILLYLMFWLVVVAAQKVMLHTRDWKWATGVMWVCVLTLLAPMLTWKLFAVTFLPKLAWFLHSVVSELSQNIGFVDSHRSLMLPVGLSFATFRALDLILQTYLRSIGQIPLGHVMAYGFFPVLLPVGPIATLQEVDFTHNATSEDVKIGLLRITVGFFKVFLLASLFQDWGNVFHSYDRPGWQLLISLVVFAFYFYLNFAGYSDIAIGTGRLFGMKLPENFRWPLFRESPQQFWASWHVSLSRFAQRYIFTSTGGYRRNRQSIALLATMMVIAWWHDLTLAWTLFGVYHGMGLAVHRWWSQHRPPLFARHVGHLWYRAVSWAMLFVFVVMGFPIISMDPANLPAFYGSLLR